MLVQWDDHEVRNNWYPGKPLASGPRMAQLAGWSRRVMVDYNPMQVAPRGRREAVVATPDADTRARKAP